MSLLFRPRPQERALTFQSVWGAGGDTSSVTNPLGINAGAVDAALRLIPVYSAVSLIADMIATAPLAFYRKGSDGTLSAMPKQPMLATAPAAYGGRIAWVHQAVASLLLRGNAYGYVTALDSDGWPGKVEWLDPTAVVVTQEQDDWFHTPTYSWRGRVLDNALMVHIPAFVMAGSCVGLSPTSLFRLQIETGWQANRFANSWFANNANPSGILRNSQKEIDPDQAARLKSRYKAAVANRDVFVTGNDWQYEALTVSSEDSQFLETIKATATQIAAIYRVQPEDIGGDTASSLTYKTLTQDAQRFNTRALGPWAARLEEALTALRPAPQFAQIDLDALAKGDKAARMAAHTAALTAGIETLDEARADESKPPLTPAQIDQWQKWYGKGGKTLAVAPADDTAPSAPVGAPATDDTGSSDDGQT